MRPPSSQSSVAQKSSGCINVAEAQLPVEPARELIEWMTCSVNPTRSDITRNAQRRLSFECIDGILDPPDEMCPSILHPEYKNADDDPKSVQSVSKNELISKKVLDEEQDFMVEQNKDVKFLGFVEEAELNLTRRDAESCQVVQNEQKPIHGEKISEDFTDMCVDSYNQSREPIVHQIEITRFPGISSQLVPEPLSGLQVSDHSHKNTTSFVKKPMRKLMLSDFKASEGKHGLLRRCFRFGNDVNSSKRLHPNASGSNSQQVPIQVETPTRLPTHSYQPVRSSFSSYEGKSPNVNLIKRTGIGLHLNSMVRTLPTAPATNHKEMQDTGNRPLKVANIKQPESHNGKRKSGFEQHDLFDELKENSSKRQRTGNDASEGCKRCHCKRARCLKLYCGCFAAGIYCTGSCSCPGCKNKPEFQDIVHDTRAYFISRNPLAFSSKIMESTSESLPNNADIIQLAQYASRPKRGCTCKKSMCVKKYCECYQANVGCSDDCRCEGCRNIFGQNTGYDEINVQAFGSASGEDLQANATKSIITRADFSNLQYHEFVTPSIHPPQVSASLSDHLSVGSTVKVTNLQPSYNADEHRLSFDGSSLSPITLGKSSQKKTLPETEYGCNFSDIKENEPGIPDHSTPVNAVNVRSANRSRDSNCKPFALHNLGSGLSYTLTKARKFILKSVPTLPAPEKGQ